MTGQSFVLDYEKIRQFREKSSQSVNDCMEMIDTLQIQMDLMQQMDVFQGEAATGIKNYFEEVHKTILNSIKTVLEDFNGKINLYANQFIENVDSELDARIPEEALEEMKSHIRFTYFDLDDIIEDINADFRSVGDIVELETLSTEAIRIDYEKRIEDLTETEWKIGELDSSFCENEVEALDGLITETKNFIHSQNAGNRTITDYEKGSCFESQTYLALKGKQEAYQKYYDENKKEIEEAIRKQLEISTSLENSRIKEKQTEETVNGWTSIGLSTLPIVGDVKDVQEAVMGIDLVTGEKLSWQERGISFVCMFVPVVSGKMVTKGGKKILVSVSKIPGKIKKVKNVVTKNTLKIKVSLKKVWSATKEAVKINFRKGKDCVVKLKNCSLNELQKLKESGHTFLENVKKIKNGEFYQYECVTPDGQRIPISAWDDTSKSKKVCSKGSSKSGKTSPKGLIGHDFEDYLTKNIGGEGSFSVGGRDFDGGIGNRWWEAKSGQYWDMLESNPNKLAKFKSDMGDRLRIATENGATYELFSNTPIPASIKQWLDKKGIAYTELLD